MGSIYKGNFRLHTNEQGKRKIPFALIINPAKGISMSVNNSSLATRPPFLKLFLNIRKILPTGIAVIVFLSATFFSASPAAAFRILVNTNPLNMSDVESTDSGEIDCNRIEKIRCDGVWTVGLNDIDSTKRLEIYDYLGPGYVVSEAFANNDGPFINVHDMTGYVNDAFYYNEKFVYNIEEHWRDHCYYLHRFMQPLPGFDPDDSSTWWPDGCGLNGSYADGYDPNTYPIIDSWWPESKTTLSPIQLAGVRYHLANQGYPNQRITVHVRNYSTTLDDENDPNSHTQYRLKRTFDSDPKLDAVTVEWFPFARHIKAWKIGDLIHEHLTAGHRVFLLMPPVPYNAADCQQDPNICAYVPSSSYKQQFIDVLDAIDEFNQENSYPDHLANARLFLVPARYCGAEGECKNGETWFKAQNPTNPDNSVEAVIEYLRSREEWNSKADVKHWIGDFNGDGISDIIRHGIGTGGGVWYITSGDRKSFEAPWSDYTIPGWPVGGDYYIGDWDGDGKSDIAYKTPTGHWYIVNAYGAQLDHNAWWGFKPNDPEYSINGQYLIGDFDGNGKSDIAHIATNSKWYILKHDGTPLSGYWGTRFTGWNYQDRLFAADINGNGYTDLIKLNSNGHWFVWDMTIGPLDGWWGHQVSDWPGDGRFFFGDLDGNGSDEIVHVDAQDDPNHQYTGHATWHAVHFDHSFDSVFSEYGATIPGWPVGGIFSLGDFNGDGRSDIAYANKGNEKWYIVQHNGAPMNGWWGGVCDLY